MSKVAATITTTDHRKHIAKIVGNSPEVIMRHYVGNVLKFDIPVV